MEPQPVFLEFSCLTSFVSCFCWVGGHWCLFLENTSEATVWSPAWRTHAVVPHDFEGLSRLDFLLWLMSHPLPPQSPEITTLTSARNMDIGKEPQGQLPWQWGAGGIPPAFSLFPTCPVSEIPVHLKSFYDSINSSCISFKLWEHSFVESPVVYIKYISKFLM